MVMSMSQLLLLEEVANSCLAFADAFSQGRFQVASRACRKVRHQSVTDLYFNEQMVKNFYRMKHVQNFSLWKAQSVTLYAMPLCRALHFMEKFHKWATKQDDSKPIKLRLKIDEQTLKEKESTQQEDDEQSALRVVCFMCLKFMLSKKHTVNCYAEASGDAGNKTLKYLTITKRLLEENETNALWDVVEACRLPENAAWQDNPTFFDFARNGNFLLPFDMPCHFLRCFMQQQAILQQLNVFKSPYAAMGLIDRCFAGFSLHQYSGAVVIMHKIVEWSVSYIDLMLLADHEVTQYEQKEKELQQQQQQPQEEPPCQQLALAKPATNRKKENEKAKKQALACVCKGEEPLPQGAWIRFKPQSKVTAVLPGFQRIPFCFGLMGHVDAVHQTGDGVLYRVQFHGIMKDEANGTEVMTTSILTSWSDDLHLCIKTFWKADEAHHLSRKSKYDQDLSKAKDEGCLQRVQEDESMENGLMPRTLKIGETIEFASYNPDMHRHLPLYLKPLYAKKAVINCIMSKGDVYAFRLQVEDDDKEEVLTVAAEDVLAILE